MNVITLDANSTPALRGGLLYYSIANTNHAPNASYDLVLLLTVTNNVGNYYTVLEQLNAPLKPHYRYEAGTSMAAPAVSGFLALMQEYLGTNFNLRPSPALLKALIINGARSLNPNYNLQINAPNNHQGWGLVDMSNSVPFGLSPGGTNGPMRFFDQKLTNSLATGGTETYEITVPDEAKSFPLRITLVWTDPPGNPVTGIKLVNDMNLSVLGDATNTVVISTNSSLTNSTSLLWLGNNFPPGSDFTDPIPLTSTDTNVLVATNLAEVIDAKRDFVNNVENVYIQPPLGSRYTVVVKAHRVNVQAVNSHPNSLAQDYALVISSGNVVPTNNVNLLVNGPVFTNDAAPRISALFRATNATSAGLLNQRVGANNPLIVSTNGASNQWSFFTYTNVPTDNFTNVAVLRFCRRTFPSRASAKPTSISTWAEVPTCSCSTPPPSRPRPAPRAAAAPKSLSSATPKPTKCSTSASNPKTSRPPTSASTRSRATCLSARAMAATTSSPAPPPSRFPLVVVVAVERHVVGFVGYREVGVDAFVGLEFWQEFAFEPRADLVGVAQRYFRARCVVAHLPHRSLANYIQAADQLERCLPVPNVCGEFESLAAKIVQCKAHTGSYLNAKRQRGFGQ